MGEGNFSFGSWLRRQRLAHDLRQADLAGRLGVATVTLRKLEADERRPSLQLIARVAEAFALSDAEREALQRVARADLSPAALPLPGRATDAGLPEAVGRTPDPRLRLLPHPLNPLIGRETELAQIAALLGDPAVRLLTLLGPGGIGKTRLAIAAAGQTAGRFADGVCFADLSPVRDPALVLPAIGRALGLHELDGRPMAAALAAFIRAKTLLLVLDNCEQVAGAAPAIAALLAEAPQLRIIATSREALRVAAERVYPVPPLAVPAAGGEILGAPAARLFLARARAGRGELALAGDAGAAVAAICRRLDGLPLALELAATRMRHLTPQALLARLARPLELLTSGARDLPPRQQTLRATIAWSYELLTDAEQALFRRLGACVGGWDLAAAEAVGGLGEATLDLLSGLIDKSLVRQQSGAGDEPLYAMLETIREYALEQLAASGELRATRDRHAEYFLGLARAARDGEYGPTTSHWIGRLQEAHANLQVALQTYAATANHRALALLCADLGWFWSYQAHFTEAAGWVEQVRAHQQALPAPVQARFLLDCSRFLFENKHRVQGLATGLALYRELGDAAGEAWAIVALAGLLRNHGDLARARELAATGLALARTVNVPGLFGEAIYVQSNLLITDAAYDRAKALLEEGLAHCRQAGDQRNIATLTGRLGMIATAQGRHRQALAYFAESASIRQILRDRRGMAAQLLNESDALRRLGDLPQACVLLAAGLAIFSEIGWVEGVGSALLSLAMLACAAGHAERGARFLGAEDACRSTVGYHLWQPVPGEYAGVVAHIRASLDAEAFAQAFAAGRSLGVEAATAEAWEWLAAAHPAPGAPPYAATRPAS